MSHFNYFFLLGGLLIVTLAPNIAHGQDAGLAQRIVSEAARADFQGPGIRSHQGGRTINWLPVEVRRRGIRPEGQVLGLLETSSRRRDPTQGVYVYIRREGGRWVVYEEAGGQIVLRSDRVSVTRTSGFRRQASFSNRRAGTIVTVSIFGATISYLR